jgi:hypothetical protein
MNGRLIALALVILLLASGAALSAPEGFAIFWWTVDGGGAVPALTGGTLSLQGTLGQPDAGMLSNGRFSLEGGFWVPSIGDSTRWVYLPIVIK